MSDIDDATLAYREGMTLADNIRLPKSEIEEKYGKGEHEHQSTADDFEVVDVADAGLDVATPPHPGSQEWDPEVESLAQFLERTRPVVKVYDDVRDSRRR